MDCEKQVQKHNSKTWDVLYISEFNEHWLNLLSHISFVCPDAKIKAKMIKEYETDKHKYNIKTNNDKLLFIHYFRYLIYGKTGFNWSSFVRLMDKLLITEYPTKNQYEEYLVNIFKKQDDEKNKVPNNIYKGMDRDAKLSDQELLDKYLPQRKNWYLDDVVDTFEYKSEIVLTGKNEDGDDIPPFCFNYHKVDERTMMYQNLVKVRPNIKKLVDDEFK